MNQNLYGDYKAAGALAGVFSGINQKQEEERQNLLNTYQGLKNQEQEFTSAEAQAKLQDPRYIQMKLSNDMAKFGQETSMNELKSGYDKSTRAVLDLQIAAQQGPEALQQKALSYLQELGIDPNSQQGQLMLQDPVGFAQKTQQYFAGAATQNSDYQQKYGLQNAQSEAHLKGIEMQGKNAMEVAKLHEQGADRRAASTGGTLSTDKEYNKQLTLALEGDEKAQRWVNAYIKNKQMVSPQYGSPAIVIGPDGQPQLGSRGDTSQVPFSNVNPTNSGSYNYVPGQGLQPTSNAQTTRTPPVSGRGSVSSDVPYMLKSGGGVVVNGKTYTYDEYQKLPISKQYNYQDLQIK